MNVTHVRISLLALLLFTVVALSACGHQHVASGWIMDPAATCTSVGHRYKRCNECDLVLEEEDYNIRHSYEEGYCIYCKRPQNDETKLKYEPITLNGQEGYTVAGIGSCNAADMVIPEKHNSRPVLAISDNAFVNAARLESVTIPKTVQSIGSRAFYNCEQLKTVRFASASGCTFIGDFAFAECPKLRNAEIPAGVTAIADSLFSGCVKLKSLTLPDSITRVGVDAFGGCTELVTRKENGLTYLGSDTNPYLILHGAEDRNADTLTLSEQTRVIAPGALAGCAALTALTLPEGICFIGAYAFSGCTALEELHIPDGVTELGAFALQDCAALSRITLPAGLKHIGSGAFFNCARLTALILPDTLASVGSTAFYGCGALSFHTYGTGKYLGTAANPYFLLCGYSTLPATEAPHADNRLMVENSDSTLIP